MNDFFCNKKYRNHTLNSSSVVSFAFTEFYNHSLNCKFYGHAKKSRFKKIYYYLKWICEEFCVVRLVKHKNRIYTVMGVKELMARPSKFEKSPKNAIFHLSEVGVR